MESAATFTFPAEYQERGLYVVHGEIRLDGDAAPPLHMAVLKTGARVEIRALGRATVMLLGGESLDGDRYIWWNFVASSKVLIEDAKMRWKQQRFPAVPGEYDSILLPDR